MSGSIFSSALELLNYISYKRLQDLSEEDDINIMSQYRHDLMLRGESFMWSKIKKQLEGIICDSLREKVEFHCSNYRMHDGIGRTYITVDGKEVYNMCTLKRDYYRTPVEGNYSQVEFIETVYKYLNTPMEDCMKTQNPLVKMILILDRRIGKRTLIKMKESIENEDVIIQYFYRLRCDAEKIH